MFQHEERNVEEIKKYYYVHRLEILNHNGKYNGSDIYKESEYSKSRLAIFESFAPSTDEDSFEYSKPHFISHNGSLQSSPKLDYSLGPMIFFTPYKLLKKS